MAAWSKSACGLPRLCLKSSILNISHPDWCRKSIEGKKLKTIQYKRIGEEGQEGDEEGGGEEGDKEEEQKEEEEERRKNIHDRKSEETRRGTGRIRGGPRQKKESNETKTKMTFAKKQQLQNDIEQ